MLNYMIQKTPHSPILILGATGDIGSHAVALVRELKIPVIGISCYQQIDKAIDIVHELGIPHLFLLKQNVAPSEYQRLDSKTSVHQGMKAVCDFIAEYPNKDLRVLNAIAGVDGLESSMVTLQAGKKLLLANKESLILGSHFLMETLQDPYQLIPLDSEHQSLFLLRWMIGESFIKDYYITASGGPFLSKDLKTFADITKKDVLNHPIWKTMGNNITVSSSTLANKGLEIIEAKELFQIPLEKIKAVVHPQAYVHGFVKLNNGSIVSYQYPPNTRIPVEQALYFPQMVEKEKEHDNLLIEAHHYYPIDENKFPMVRLAYEAGKHHYSQILFTIANDFANSAFLDDQIKYLDIYRFVEYILGSVSYKNLNHFTTVLDYIKDQTIYIKEQLKRFH